MRASVRRCDSATVVCGGLSRGRIGIDGSVVGWIEKSTFGLEPTNQPTLDWIDDVSDDDDDDSDAWTRG